MVLESTKTDRCNGRQGINHGLKQLEHSLYSITFIENIVDKPRDQIALSLRIREFEHNIEQGTSRVGLYAVRFHRSDGIRVLIRKPWE